MFCVFYVHVLTIFAPVQVMIILMLAVAIGGFAWILCAEIYRSFRFALVLARIEDRRARTIKLTINERYKGPRRLIPSELAPPLPPAPSRLAAVSLLVVTQLSPLPAGALGSLLGGSRSAREGLGGAPTRPHPHRGDSTMYDTPALPLMARPACVGGGDGGMHNRMGSSCCSSGGGVVVGVAPFEFPVGGAVIRNPLYARGRGAARGKGGGMGALTVAVVHLPPG